MRKTVIMTGPESELRILQMSAEKANRLKVTESWDTFSKDYRNPTYVLVQTEPAPVPRMYNSGITQPAPVS